MKKVISAILFISMLFSFTSCTRKNIASVTINNETYSSCYLYKIEGSDPHKTVYGYSETKYEKKDTVWIWDDNKQTTTEASIVSIVSKYPIKIKEKQDTFVITYYTIESGTFSDLSSAENVPPEKHKVEVAKENVTIEYYP